MLRPIFEECKKYHLRKLSEFARAHHNEHDWEVALWCDKCYPLALEVTEFYAIKVVDRLIKSK